MGQYQCTTSLWGLFCFEVGLKRGVHTTGVTGLGSQILPRCPVSEQSHFMVSGCQQEAGKHDCQSSFTSRLAAGVDKYLSYTLHEQCQDYVEKSAFGARVGLHWHSDICHWLAGDFILTLPRAHILTPPRAHIEKVLVYGWASFILLSQLKSNEGETQSDFQSVNRTRQPLIHSKPNALSNKTQNAIYTCREWIVYKHLPLIRRILWYDLYQTLCKYLCCYSTVTL